MIGSSISAILSYMMKIEVPAPHGGFLILGLVNKPMMWVVCILAGSAVGALLYVLVTPKVEVENKIEEAVSTKGLDSVVESLYNENTVSLELRGTTKEEVLKEMTDLLYKDGVLTNKEKFLAEINKREASGSTGFGNGVAIPHAKASVVVKPRVAVGISKKGFEFDSVDGKPVHLIFMIAAGEGDNDLHLRTLSSLAQSLMDEEYVESLLVSRTKKEIVSLLG